MVTDQERVCLLSPRELEVFVRLAIGKTCRQIAEILNISVKTTDTHRGHVLRKLNIAKFNAGASAHLARFALRLGFVGLAHDDPLPAYVVALERAKMAQRENRFGTTNELILERRRIQAASRV